MPRKSDPLRYWRRIVAEYQPQEDIFCEDEPRVALCKKALAELPDSDRQLFILYAETGSVRRVAQLLNMSSSTLQYRILKIRTHLRRQVGNTNNHKTNDYGTLSNYD